jgi:hypothetical protein
MHYNLTLNIQSLSTTRPPLLHAPTRLPLSLQRHDFVMNSVLIRRFPENTYRSAFLRDDKALRLLVDARVTV